MLQKWKSINGYEGLYEVSNFGEIRSLDRQVMHKHTGCRKIKGRIKKLMIDRDGYPVVKLSKNGKKCHFGVHRLVATAFIENPLELPQVNHKDGIKTNNHSSNLEWVTCSENAIHAFGLGLRKSSWIGKGSMKGRFGADHNQAKAVIQKTMDGVFVRRYAFIKDAKKYGFQPTHIGACAKGKIPHHRKFKWEYECAAVLKVEI